MEKPELVYIFDTMCGWCYGATPILVQARSAFGDSLDITLVHGGLFTGENAHTMAEMRPIALAHDRRIHDITKQPFSDAYRAKIVMNDDVIQDSTPTAMAHHVVKRHAPGKLLEFTQSAQHARFVNGQDLTCWSTYIPLVKPLGIGVKQFFDEFYNDATTRDAVTAEFEHARALMAAARAEGFPTLLFHRDDVIVVIPHGHLLSAPRDIVPRLRELM